MKKKLLATFLCVAIIGLWGCTASGEADDHKGKVKVEGNE